MLLGRPRAGAGLVRGWCGAGAGLVRGWAHRRVVPDEVDRREELRVEDALEEVLLVRVRAGVS